MKKNMFVLGLFALAFTGVMYTAEVADDFGLETLTGYEGYAHIHNNNKEKVWAALITQANIDGKGGEAIEVVAVPAKPTSTRPGASALVSLPITSNKEATLAIWNNDPNIVTATKGMIYGFSINPKPVTTYKFTLPTSKNQIFLELNGNKITEQ